MTQHSATVLVIDDDRMQQAVLTRWLEAREYVVAAFGSAEEALEGLTSVLPDVVLLDVGLPGMDGHSLLARLQQAVPELPVVMLTGDESVQSVVRAVRGGASDYLTKPVDRRRLYEAVEAAVRIRGAHLAGVAREREARGGTHGMVGRSPVMRELFRQIDRLGPSRASVVIHGESGVGKELVAQALHAASPRARGPFVPVNCAAIPATLQESELFGHVRGAFTGAARDRAGRLAQADGGTLFLDEVAELSAGLQATLLRALQERRFNPVGSDVEIEVDIRVIAASHQDLLEAVEAGRFREDLFYRLAVVELEVPALRERGEDVIALALAFLEEISAGRLTLSPSARDALLQHDWPGNVRELRNAIERATVLCEGSAVEAADLPERVRSGSHRSDDAAERAELVRALDAHGGNVTEVVRALGLPRSSLYRKLKKYGLR